MTKQSAFEIKTKNMLSALDLLEAEWHAFQTTHRSTQRETKHKQIMESVKPNKTPDVPAHRFWTREEMVQDSLAQNSKTLLRKG